MRPHLTLTITCFLVMLGSTISNAQCFNKGSLLLSISEGTTYDKYMTTDNSSDAANKGNITGDRDPISLEYGLTRHWGIGLNMGGDVLNINPATYYNLQVPGNRVKVITSEFTVDVHYHYFVTKKTDLSFIASLGASSVTLKLNEGDRNLQYNAGGGIMRLGTQARYYLFRRFGIHGIFSMYSASYSTNGVKGNTIANNYSTGISGFAWEMGFFFRFFK